MSHELSVLNNQLKEESATNSHINKRLKDDLNNENDQTMPKTGKQKRMACVECRQQKSRCDAHEKHPEPCSRCFKKGLKCDLKSNYKRTYKRARIAQIEKEFLELKNSLNAAQAAELLSKVPTLSNSQFVTGSSISPIDSSRQLVYGENNSIISSHPTSGSQSPFRHSDVAPHKPDIWHQKYSGPDNNQDSSETNNSIPNTPSIHKVPELTSESFQIVDPFSKTNLPDYVLLCREKTLGIVTLSSARIRELYLEFVDCYHPILPVVDVSKGPERIYKLCPALFWVIMFISLRRFKDEFQKNLLLQLSPLIKDILAEITISPITRYNPTEEDDPILNACSVYSVQAFLLYTFWPPIASSLSADSSWNTIGVALFQAIRIGLHTPIPSQTPESSKTPHQIGMANEQAKTWIVCNIVSQTIASAFGFPAFVQFDSSVWSSCRPESSINIPKSIQFMMEIAHFEDEVAKTLNSNPMDPHGLIDPTERLPLLKVLSKHLDGLELKLMNEVPVEDGFRKFQLLTARLHLLTYYFMDSARIATFELQKGLVRLYNSAIALINHAEICQAKDKRFIKYLPGVDILNIWQASCIIVKLAHSSMKKVVDLGTGKQSYQVAISLAAEASILRHDIAYRASGIMRNLWQLFRTLDEKNLTTLSISIKTRMSASIFFDCLFLLREQVGMIKLNNRTDENSGPGEGDDNEAGSYEDEDNNEESDENEEVAVEDVSNSEESSQKGPTSTKSTPSSQSSGRRKARSLSNTVDAESKARKIIRTIPLDPRPISVSGGKRSSIFKVVNNSTDSSPRVRSDKGSPDSNSKRSPDARLSAPIKDSSNFINPSMPSGAISAINNRQSQHQNQPGVFTQQNRIPVSAPMGHIANAFSNRRTNAAPASSNAYKSGESNIDFSDMVFNESSMQRGLENIEIDGLGLDSIEINSDLLWKDVDSVMNDFGFHTQ